LEHIVALVFCLFMGITAISMGVGALAPQINRIAQPMVCPGGTMNYQTSVKHTAPGTTYTLVKWTCDDAAGKQSPIGVFTLGLYAGSLQGLVLFAVVEFFMLLAGFRPKAA